MALAALNACSDTDQDVGNAVMTLEVCGSRFIENPSDEQILAELSDLDTKCDDSFAILGASDMTYIQIWGDENVGFDLEYQEGSIDSHFRAKNDDIPLDQVVGAFIAYRNGDNDWRDNFDFE
jgi:hypothetical protein